MSDQKEERFIYIIAVENQDLFRLLDDVFSHYTASYEAIPPDRLVTREYPHDYMIFLETSGDLERMKKIAREVCRRWGKTSGQEPTLTNFLWVYYPKSDLLKDKDVFDLWFIAGPVMVHSRTGLVTCHEV